jgi:hypothetical protein
LPRLYAAPPHHPLYVHSHSTITPPPASCLAAKPTTLPHRPPASPPAPPCTRARGWHRHRPDPPLRRRLRRSFEAVSAPCLSSFETGHRDCGHPSSTRFCHLHAPTLSSLISLRRPHPLCRRRCHRRARPCHHGLEGRRGRSA